MKRSGVDGGISTDKDGPGGGSIYPEGRYPTGWIVQEGWG